MIRIRSAILLANGGDLLATIRPKAVLCENHKREITTGEVLSLIPPGQLEAVAREAKIRTGFSPAISLTQIDWVRIINGHG